MSRDLDGGNEVGSEVGGGQIRGSYGWRGVRERKSGGDRERSS